MSRSGDALGAARAYRERIARSLRSELPAFGVYHVTARGVEKRAIFADTIDCRRFVAFLELAVERHAWTVLAYCLMTNHIHIVVSSSLSDLTQGMHLLMSRYAQTFNERHERVGHLFQGRFHSRSVEDDEYLAHVCDYVFDNPVRAGLCGERADWPWLGGALSNYVRAA